MLTILTNFAARSEEGGELKGFPFDLENRNEGKKTP